MPLLRVGRGRVGDAMGMCLRVMSWRFTRELSGNKGKVFYRGRLTRRQRADRSKLPVYSTTDLSIH